MNATKNKLPRFNGPASYNAAQRLAYRQVRAKYPDAYGVAGLGWCGPGWEELSAEMARIDAGVQL